MAEETEKYGVYLAVPHLNTEVMNAVLQLNQAGVKVYLTVYRQNSVIFQTTEYDDYIHLGVKDLHAIGSDVIVQQGKPPGCQPGGCH